MYPVYVEQMFNTIYTYTYTGEAETVYFRSELVDTLTFMGEVNHVFSYYKKMGILQSYSCTCVNLSKEAVDDLLLLAGWNGTSMTTSDFNIIELLLDEAATDIEECTTFVDSNKLGYVTFFDKKWYLPCFNTSMMSCKEIISYIASTSLLEWYTAKLVTVEQPDYKTLCERLDRLSTREVKQPSTETSSSMESESTYDTTEIIDTYLQIYLEPATKCELLLSDIYENYMSRAECMPHVKKVVFIRQLRTHSRFTITRHARGMVVMNYAIAKPSKIYYMKSGDMYRDSHVCIMDKYEQVYQPKNYPTFPYERASFFLLSLVSNIEVSNVLMRYFVADPSTDKLLECCTEYLKRLAEHNVDMHDTPTWEAICKEYRNHDHNELVSNVFDLSEREREYQIRAKRFMESSSTIASLCSEKPFPFSNTILCDVEKNKVDYAFPSSLIENYDNCTVEPYNESTLNGIYKSRTLKGQWSDV